MEPGQRTRLPIRCLACCGALLLSVLLLVGCGDVTLRDTEPQGNNEGDKPGVGVGPRQAESAQTAGSSYRLLASNDRPYIKPQVSVMPDGTCKDRWISQSVEEVTGVQPYGNVCKITLYGGGQWGSYEELKGYVQSVMSTCNDKWVTQAFIEVTARKPVQQECNIYLYGNGSWSGYEDLLRKVAQQRGVPVQQAPSGAPAPGFNVDQRREMVENSYKIAFGRWPNGEEMSYWMGVPGGDSRVANLDSLINNHRNWLRTNEAERKATMERAFQQVYGHNVWKSQKEHFNRRLEEEAQTGRTYDELISHLTEMFVDQATGKIFFWDQSIEPSDQEVDGWIEQVRQGTLWGEGIWTKVALSNDETHGAAQVYYNGDRAVFSDEENVPGNRDRCFGNVGKACNAAPEAQALMRLQEGGMAEYLDKKPYIMRFIRHDGVNMYYLEQAVVVGSIFHDAACRNPHGSVCDDDWWELPLTLVNNSIVPAAEEWNKAVYNTLDLRFWPELFGPYPVTSWREELYSDDLREAPNRPAKMAPVGNAPVIGLSVAFPVPINDYNGGEKRATLRLEAPEGTNLDVGDQAFCESGRASEVHWNFELKRWITCL